MADRRITCVNTSGTHEGITTVGGSWGPTTRTQAVSDINSGTHSYHTLVAGKRAEVKVFRVIYLRTYEDSDWSDNLLALPSCS